jgi:hypothetical protein
MSVCSVDDYIIGNKIYIENSYRDSLDYGSLSSLVKSFFRLVAITECSSYPATYYNEACTFEQLSSGHYNRSVEEIYYIINGLKECSIDEFLDVLMELQNDFTYLKSIGNLIVLFCPDIEKFVIVLDSPSCEPLFKHMDWFNRYNKSPNYLCSYLEESVTCSILYSLCDFDKMIIEYFCLNNYLDYNYEEFEDIAKEY